MKIRKGRFRYAAAIVISLVAVSICPVIAKSKQCTTEEAIQAETEASTLSNWGSTYKSFRRFSHCDDASIGEGYSDTIARLLTQDWKHFGRLVQLAKINKPFERFVLRHIDELMSPDQAILIKENVRTRCPSGAERLCKSIESRLDEVDRNLNQRPE